MTVGNYWIYENYKIDSVGNESKMEQIDSVFIARDTLINGNSYFIFMGTNYPLSNKIKQIAILRDSLHYLVNHEGLILFSSENYSDTFVTRIQTSLEDTIYISYYKMTNHLIQFSVPAGTFEVINYQGEINYIHTIQGIDNPRYCDNYYAKGIGKVFSSNFFLFQAGHMEKRLVRYQVCQ